METFLTTCKVGFFGTLVDRGKGFFGDIFFLEAEETFLGLTGFLRAGSSFLDRGFFIGITFFVITFETLLFFTTCFFNEGLFPLSEASGLGDEEDFFLVTDL